MTLKLSKRLSAIAALIPPQGGVADIGTDHGYIPVWLCQNGHEGKIVASDINEDPLESAINTAIQYDCVDKIDFSLCDGLGCVCGKRTQAIVIAGMGGETISAILSAAPWTADPQKTLILQPMTKSALLREWLFKNGYKITREKLIEDERIYEIITATGGEDVPYSPAEFLVGHRDLLEDNPLYIPWLEGQIGKTKRTIFGLSASKKPEDAEKIPLHIEILNDLIEIRDSISTER